MQNEAVCSDLCAMAGAIVVLKVLNTDRGDRGSVQHTALEAYIRPGQQTRRPHVTRTVVLV